MGEKKDVFRENPVKSNPRGSDSLFCRTSNPRGHKNRAHPTKLGCIRATTSFPPICRAEHRSFYREQPEGAPQGCGASAEGLGSPFCRPSIKAPERRTKAASGPPFLWILSFGGAKESISVVGPRTDIKSSRRASDSLFCKTPNRHGHKNCTHLTKLANQ